MSEKNQQQTGSNLTLVEWCDQQVKDGKELMIRWDGGGDSGWVYFEIDGDTVENEYTEMLIDHMYSTLDYGSWAGEFHASGSAIYSMEEKAFVGTDFYNEDSTISWKVNAEIRIPKRIWFDDFRFFIDGYEEPTADFDFFIKNGFRTPEHDEILKDLNSKMNVVIDDAIDDFKKYNEFRSLYESVSISRSEFVEDGDDIVYKVEHLEMGTIHGNDNDIYLNVEDIDNHRIKES